MKRVFGGKKHKDKDDSKHVATDDTGSGSGTPPTLVRQRSKTVPQKIENLSSPALLSSSTGSNSSIGSSGGVSAGGGSRVGSPIVVGSSELPPIPADTELERMFGSLLV